MKVPLTKTEFEKNNNSSLPNANWLSNLVYLGASGHYPLFYPEWMKDFYAQSKVKTKKMTGKDKKFISKLNSKLAQYQSIERKRIMLCTLASNERDLYIQHFLLLVEVHLLDKRPELH